MNNYLNQFNIIKNNQKHYLIKKKNNYANKGEFKWEADGK